ncbi:MULTISPECIES: Card1-like endonuclease domain-containing protein [unclassified Fusibacter]|uniref:Card1-like endonuclease domain-containing protein n=1 Tax=unclassified Fusibacter TaxID=2624464 RepID=UPI001010F7A7|nr:MULTISPECIES: DUF1887 family CARF protein [unclassified Fusibacter]MCK8061662.1 DUF1887 family CARF protein [Fusibacter sp. A2]NPE23846.1 DUF1887 family protein [Fusibacter sp. A1]RXV58619.1 DUF1887 family protein [Fusibacter sp. A1]
MIYCFTHTNFISNYIGIKYTKDKQVIIFHDHSQNDRIQRYQLQTYLKREGIKSISFRLIDYTSMDQIKMAFSKIKSTDTLILPELDHARHVNLFTLLGDYTFVKLFIESDGEIYNIDNDGSNHCPNDDVKLSISDFISQTDGKIIQTNNQLFEHPSSEKLLIFILNHLKHMQKILKHVRPMKKWDAGYVYPQVSPFSIVDLTLMNPKEQEIYTSALKLLEIDGLLAIKTDEKLLTVEFYDLRFKEYFTKAGTWLEHYTQRQLRQISEIRDVNSSVMFVWDDHSKTVKNEVDIMAVTENQLITISCKDTSKLVDDYLYEIESHADLLGTEDALKIIVTTASSNKFIDNRAKLLDVHIVRYTGDHDAFNDAILHILDV